MVRFKSFVSVILLTVCVSVIVLCFSGFVSSDTYPVCSGSVYLVPGQSYTPQTTLSGLVEFYFNSYEGLIVDENGYLANMSTVQLTGELRVGSAVYPIRISAGASVIQVQQLRSGSMQQSSSWFSYDLVPQSLPSSMSLSAISLVYILAVFVACSVLFVIGRFL